MIIQFYPPSGTNFPIFTCKTGEKFQGKLSPSFLCLRWTYLKERKKEEKIRKQHIFTTVGSSFQSVSKLMCFVPLESDHGQILVYYKVLFSSCISRRQDVLCSLHILSKNKKPSACSLLLCSQPLRHCKWQDYRCQPQLCDVIGKRTDVTLPPPPSRCLGCKYWRKLEVDSL